jgi:putative glycosyl hydrolase-like family 15 (GHL15) protein
VRKLLVLTAGVLSLVYPGSAGAVQYTFGTTSVGTSTNPLDADAKAVNMMTSPKAGALVNVQGYLDGLGAGSGSQKIKAVVYSVSNGNPATLLGTSNEVTITAGRAAGWVTFTFPSKVVIPSGAVAVGYIRGGPTTRLIRAYADTAAGTRKANADAYSNGASNPFGTVTNTINALFALKVTGDVPSSLSVMRINPAAPIPADLSKYSILFLDSSRWAQVAGIKAQYPNLKVLAYKNLGFVCDYAHSMDDNSGVTWEEANLHSDWFLYDSNGVRQASQGYPQCYFMDVGLSSYQQAWASNVIAWAAKAPWDGIIMDDVNADDGWHLNGCYSCLAKYHTRDLYKNAVESGLGYTAGQLKAASYLAIPNIGASWDQPGVWAPWATLASGAVREQFLKWNSGTDPVFTGSDWTLHTEIEKAVQNANRLFVGITYGPSTYTSAQIYVRASFLILYNPDIASVDGWGDGVGGGFDSPSFTCDPGYPLGAATQNGSTWTRQFNNGTVTVNTATGTATLPC